MHAAPHRSTPFLRTRAFHIVVPLVLSVGLVCAGYTVLSDMADSIAATVVPNEDVTRSNTDAVRVEPVAPSAAPNAIAAN